VGDVDLGLTGDGRWGIYWTANDCPVGSTFLQYLFQGSNLYYIKLQVRNHRVPISKVEFQGTDSAWYPGARTPDNFWLVNPFTYPFTWPLTVRVTSIAGHQVIDKVPEFGTGVVDGSNRVQLNSISSSSPTAPVKPPTSPVAPVKPPANPTAPVSPPANPTAPVKPPANPTAPVKPPSSPSPIKCGLSGCTVKDNLVEFIAPSGVTVSSATVKCGDGTSVACSVVSGSKYGCSSTAVCANPIPQINGNPCPLTLGTTAQTCSKIGATINDWWVEFSPPSGYSLSATSVKCSDGRYFACGTDFGTKVAAGITERVCLSPTPIYNGSPCPFPSALLSDSSSNQSGELSAGSIVGICIAIGVLFLLIVIIIVVRNKMISERQEIV
jgi:hypothetical protein